MTRTRTAFLTLGFVGLLTAGWAQAGEHGSTITGSGGKSVTRSVDRTAAGTTATATSANGKTASRVTTRSGTGTSVTTVSGPNGKTGSATVTHQ